MSQQDDRMTSLHGHKRRLTYIVTEDWFFVTHFLQLARAARDSGFDVSVITQVSRYGSQLAAEGFEVMHLAADRRAIGPLALLQTIMRMRTAIRTQRTDVIHAIALKSVVLSGIAGSFAGRPTQIFSLTGLGYLWTQESIPASLARNAVRLLVRIFGATGKSIFTFENDDDAKEFNTLTNRVVIGGWGMEPEDFTREAVREPGPVRIVFIGRMLRSKGIKATVQAVEMARQSVDVELEIWGTPDEGNATSLTTQDLQTFSQIEGVHWRGRSERASDAWRRADIAILLSDREGMPRALIEAAAAGLPMIATDVPGCRSIVKHGLNGFLVPRDDIAQSAEAIVKLATSPEMRQQMGRIARKDFEERFSTDKIVPRILELYSRL